MFLTSVVFSIMYDQFSSDIPLALLVIFNGMFWEILKPFAFLLLHQRYIRWVDFKLKEYQQNKWYSVYKRDKQEHWIIENSSATHLKKQHYHGYSV